MGLTPSPGWGRARLRLGHPLPAPPPRWGHWSDVPGGSLRSLGTPPPGSAQCQGGLFLGDLGLGPGGGFGEELVGPSCTRQSIFLGCFGEGVGKKAGKSSQRVVRSDTVPSHISIPSPPPCTTHGIGTGATSCLPQFPLLPHQLQFFWGGHTLSPPYASSMRGHVPPPRFRRMQGCSLSPPGSGQHPRAAARSWVLGGGLRWDAPSPIPPGSGLAAPANPLRLHPEQLARLQPGPSLPSQQVPPGTPPLSRGLGVLPPPLPMPQAAPSPRGRPGSAH